MIRLRALRGHMGKTEFFLTTATFGEVARIVEYKEDGRDWPVAIRQQRPLNNARIRTEMVPYLTENDDHFYNALVVEHVRPGEVRHEVRFVPDEEESLTGWVELEGSEHLEALDGQHRLKSIELAVTKSPDLAREHIGMVIVPHKSVDSSQQLFSDLNRNAKPTPKALNIMFEHREREALLAKELVNQSRCLHDRVNLTGSSLSERSPHIVTIASLYEAVKILVGLLDGDLDSDVRYLADMWDTAIRALPGISELEAGTTTAGALRKRYVYVSGLGFEALAEAIKAAIEERPDDWKDFLTEWLPKINWELASPQWEGIALFAGRIAIARAARRKTANLIKHLLGLRLDQDPEKERTLREELVDAFSATERVFPQALR